jgi:RNA polymerase sigma factor (sigma-70 family)
MTTAIAEAEVAGGGGAVVALFPAPARCHHKRANHFAKHPPERFVRYPKSKPLLYSVESRLVRLAQAGDEDARNRLWVQHLRLVLSVVNDFRIPEALLSDAIQEGALGIKRAIEKFEVERYNSFSTYAWRWVYQYIQRFLVGDLFLARLPSYIFPDYMRFRKELNAAGTPDDERRVYDRWRAADRKTYHRVLLVHAMTEVVPSHLLERADQPPAPDEEEPEKTDWKGLVADSLRVLHDRERDVIVLRYGLSGEPAMSLKEVGKRYGLTRERIRQIQEKAEQRLYRHLKDDIRLPFDQYAEDAEANEDGDRGD